MTRRLPVVLATVVLGLTLAAVVIFASIHGGAS